MLKEGVVLWGDPEVEALVPVVAVDGVEVVVVAEAVATTSLLKIWMLIWRSTTQKQCKLIKSIYPVLVSFMFAWGFRALTFLYFLALVITL